MCSLAEHESLQVYLLSQSYQHPTIKVTTTKLFHIVHHWLFVTLLYLLWFSLRKQPTFCNATTGFLMKYHLRNVHRNSILTILLIRSGYLVVSLHRRHNLTSVTSAKQCRYPCSGPPTDLMNSPKQHLEFPFILIGKSTMTFLTLEVPRVTKVNFLPTKSMHNQSKMLWESIK